MREMHISIMRAYIYFTLQMCDLPHVLAQPMNV